MAYSHEQTTRLTGGDDFYRYSCVAAHNCIQIVMVCALADDKPTEEQAQTKQLMILLNKPISL